MKSKQKSWFLEIPNGLRFDIDISMDIDEVTDYKHLGNIINSTKLSNQDPLKKP